MKLGLVFAVFGFAIVILGSELPHKAPKSAFAVEPPPCISAFDGLVSWWPGDLDADDIQGSNRGLLMNGAELTEAIVGDGFSLDGEDDYVEVPDSDSLDVVDGMTLNAWVYWEGFSDGDTSVIAEKPGSFSFGIRSFGGAQLYASIDQVGGRQTFVSSGGNFFPQDRWVYVSLVFNPSGSEAILYVDGAPFASESLVNQGGVQASEAALTIGASAGEGGFQGTIDEVEFYNRALSRDEIETLIASRESGKCSGSLEVLLSVVPNWNETAFDLVINDEVKADDLVRGGTTGKIRVPPGFQIITRTAGDGYYVQGFVTAYECRDDGDLIIRWWNGATLDDLPVGSGQSVVCNITLYETGCDGAAYENVIVGDDDDNVLIGTEGRDVVLGLGGDDTINGLEGDDCLVGGPGNDDVTGGGGEDLINDYIGTPPPPPPPPPAEAVEPAAEPVEEPATEPAE